MKYFVLCNGRHPMPKNDGYIFLKEVNPLNHVELEEEARDFLRQYQKHKVSIYVTGLTVALIAVLNACKDLNINVTLLHYNRDTNKYYTQKVK